MTNNLQKIAMNCMEMSYLPKMYGRYQLNIVRHVQARHFMEEDWGAKGWSREVVMILSMRSATINWRVASSENTVWTASQIAGNCTSHSLWCCDFQLTFSFFLYAFLEHRIGNVRFHYEWCRVDEMIREFYRFIIHWWISTCSHHLFCLPKRNLIEF